MTGDPAERTAIAEQMLALHEKNMWIIAYVEAAPAYHAVNARVHNFPAQGDGDRQNDSLQITEKAAAKVKVAALLRRSCPR